MAVTEYQPKYEPIYYRSICISKDLKIVLNGSNPPFTSTGVVIQIFVAFVPSILITYA